MDLHLGSSSQSEICFICFVCLEGTREWSLKAEYLNLIRSWAFYFSSIEAEDCEGGCLSVTVHNWSLTTLVSIYLSVTKQKPPCFRWVNIDPHQHDLRFVNRSLVKTWVIYVLTGDECVLLRQSCNVGVSGAALKWLRLCVCVIVLSSLKPTFSLQEHQVLCDAAAEPDGTSVLYPPCSLHRQ